MSVSIRDLVVGVFDDVLASGLVESAIKKQIEETLKNSLSDAFGRYGEFSKALNKALAKSLHLPEDLPIPSYNDTLIKIVQEVVGQEIEGTIAARVRNKIVDLLEPAPAKMKLSELIESYQEYVKDYNGAAGCHCGEAGITAILEEDGKSPGWQRLFLGAELNAEKKKCDFEVFFTGDGKMWHFSEKYSSSRLFSTSHSGFAKKLLWLSEAGTRIEFDCDPSDLDLTIDYHDGD